MDVDNALQIIIWQDIHIYTDGHYDTKFQLLLPGILSCYAHIELMLTEPQIIITMLISITGLALCKGPN